jgi:hypothetical protein
MIGKLERVELREVWKHEALDFTTWMQDNIDVLGDAIGKELSNAEREQNAGSFSVDILAEDAGGDAVVIENQLERSDHDHLGKLITYLTAFDAKTAIWISSDPRPEHVQAVAWLNESSSASFYFLKVEAIRIGDSHPAPLLTLIVGPSDESREIGKKKKEFAEKHEQQRRYWVALLTSSKSKTKLFTNISPTAGDWIRKGADRPGLSYQYFCNKYDSYVRFVVDREENVAGENIEILQTLMVHRDTIESDCGGALIWDMKEGRRCQYITVHFQNIGWHEDLEPQWPTMHNKMIDAMIRLEKALNPHINKLNI